MQPAPSLSGLVSGPFTSIPPPTVLSKEPGSELQRRAHVNSKKECTLFPSQKVILTSSSIVNFPLPHPLTPLSFALSSVHFVADKYILIKIKFLSNCFSIQIFPLEAA